jgi:plasmid stabilization system protein ParE
MDNHLSPAQSDYIAQDSPQAALNVGYALTHTAKLLDTMPLLGKIGRATGARELVALPNDIIIYRLLQGVSQILRIKHAAMKM